MPSTGKNTIAQKIGAATFLVGDKSIEFKQDGEFVKLLSEAIDTGWISASPSVPTAMATSFAASLSHLQGDGLAAVQAIASGIDLETATWSASWNPLTVLHVYAPTAETINAAIMAASPVQSNGMTSLAQAVADAFMDGFEKEAG
jgi:hypothetical protein